MEQSPTVIAPRRSTPAAERLISRFLGGSVPPELLRTARGRVAKLSLFILVVSALTLPFFLGPWGEKHFGGSPVAVSYYVLLMVLSSGAMYLVSRLRWVSSQRLLDLALVYEVVLAFGTGVARHSMPWPEVMLARDWSEVAVWIVLFAVVIPNTQGKALLAALLAALMDPLGLVIGVSAGLPMPDGPALGSIFGPTFFAVILAAFLSRFVLAMGHRIEEAEKLGSYRLIERLGSGGMGEVWRAEHAMLARPAAVKLIPPARLASHDARTTRLRFEREAKATAMLESPSTIRLYDFGVTDEGTFYYVMEYLDGLDLDELVERFGPLRPERAVYLLLQICDSLEEAHRTGLIHRDVKPANIYVCRRGLHYDVAKVLDFGLAKWSEADTFEGPKLTHEGSIAGTPAFIAPEAITGDGPIDGRADLYSLGCVAFWMLTGRLVFDEDTPMKLLLAHAHREPPDLVALAEQQIPVELEAIVVDCLCKRPDGRPQSAAAMARRLAAIELESPWTAERARHWWRTNLPRRRTAGAPRPPVDTQPVTIDDAAAID